MYLFLIFILLALLLLFLRVSKAVSKFVAVFIDFLLIGGFTAYFLHGKVSVNIASGNAVYFWDIVFGLVACLLYFIILNYLVISFPKIAAFINYVISWIGTLLIYGMVFLIFNGGFPQLLNNENVSLFINLIIVSILAFITFNIRKNIFGIPSEHH